MSLNVLGELELNLERMLQISWTCIIRILCYVMLCYVMLLFVCLFICLFVLCLVGVKKKRLNERKGEKTFCSRFTLVLIALWFEVNGKL